IAVISTDLDVAITKLRRAVELCDCTPDAARLQLGELLIDQGQWDEAKEQFLRILRVQSGNARALLGLGRVMYEQGQLSDAVAHLTRCTADPHTRKAASTLLAQVYGRLANPSAAEQALRQVAELPKDAEWVDPFQEKVHELQVGQQTALVRADKLINQGRYSDAVRLLQQTVQDYPNSASGWMMLGRAWIGGKDPGAAERSLRKAIEMDPAVADAQFYLGVALFLQKQHAAAATCFRQAVELKPDFAQAHLDLGHCLREQGDDTGAMAAFRTAIQQKPDYAAAHFNLAALLLKRGQREEALVHLRHAVRLNPADRGARWLLDQALKQTTGPAGM
ncbi:MAG TPA: tetratricopeptide repeat protein, partial [Gemmataceae bacterium]|nr:tetratricopeptide repeat protein [Gemmataceae bacterium]